EGNDGISAAEMLAQSNKPDVVSSDHIEPGQNIRVPRETGILHVMFGNRTAAQLAEDYGVSVDDLYASPYNDFGEDGLLVTGQEVFIPNPTRIPVHQEAEIPQAQPTPEPTPTEEPAPEAPPTEEPPAPAETPVEEPQPTEPPEEPTPTPGIEIPDVPILGPLETPTPTPTPEPEETEEPEPTPTRPPTSSFFIWPVSGPISSYFDASHPLGIDIDLYDNPNAEIVAARGGTVVFAGGDPCCSYGYYVIIEHESGIRTLYAHLSRIVVSVGEEVAQGELIGFGGRTGYATGNHLHFEIRVDDNPVDPLRYLP